MCTCIYKFHQKYYKLKNLHLTIFNTYPNIIIIFWLNTWKSALAIIYTYTTILSFLLICYCNTNLNACGWYPSKKRIQSWLCYLLVYNIYIPFRQSQWGFWCSEQSKHSLIIWWSKQWHILQSSQGDGTEHLDWGEIRHI